MAVQATPVEFGPFSSTLPTPPTVVAPSLKSLESSLNWKGPVDETGIFTQIKVSQEQEV